MLLAALALLPGCRRKATPPPVEAPPLASAAAPAPLGFAPDPEVRVGLPRGCTLEGQPRSAEAGEGALFFAPDEPRDELALLVPGEPVRAGIVRFGGSGAAGAGAAGAGGAATGAAVGGAGAAGGAVRALWAMDPGRPPLLAAGGRGWLGYASAGGAEGEPGRALVLREGAARPEVELVGDGVEAVDLRCRGGHCAALSTRASRVAAAGATVLLGQADTPARGWGRVDYAPETAAAERPFVVAAVGPGQATVTTVSAEGVRFFEARAGGTTGGTFVPAPHGALEAIQLRRSVVVGHGAKLEGDCAVPRPSLLVAREGAEPVQIAAEAPALSVFARPLARGALVAWLVPTHCGDRLRRVAYAALLDDEGALRSGPMAVADATGLAVATAGDRAELWLRRGRRVVWLRLRCD